MRTALVLFLAIPAFAGPALAGPSLLTSSADIARMQRLAKSDAWAAQAVKRLIAEADAWPQSHVKKYGLAEWAIPTEGGGWSHAYVCPVHGARLSERGAKNVCPIDGKDYHGYPIDNVVYSHRSIDNAASARDLGLAYVLTGKAEYAEKARRILNAYAAIYPTLPIHDNNNKLDTKSGARVMSQTLSEASWLVPMAFAYDLVRDTMTPADRARFERDLLRNAAAVIRRYNAGASNWQSWHNAALLAAGLLTGEKEVVTLALDGPGGFKFQVKQGITPDGPWHEGAWGYHFFALQPLLLTREMAARAGINLPEANALKRMLDAPLLCVFPDGTLPNFNDSGYTTLKDEARWYEMGYRLFHDARYLTVANAAPRGIDSLLWGADSLPAATSAPPLTSAILPDAGIAILRAAGSDHTVAIKFGAHGGGHGHFDKLSFISYADGRRMAADPGTQAYAAKTHATWDKTTIAHNTLSVDEKQQAQATGKLLEWKPGANSTTIRVSAGEAYPGVEIVRTLVHTAAYTLDIVEAHATDGKPHQFDWIYHDFGALSTELPVEPYTKLPAANGYQHLTNARAAVTSGDWKVSFGPERVWMRGAPGTTVVTGEGLGPDLQTPVPFVMARRTGTSARFVTVYDPSGTLKQFPALPAGLQSLL
jgi:oligo-alginate lyase